MQYPQAIHTKDENGAFVNIDNALTSNLLGTYDTTNARIKFAKKIGSGAGVLVLKDTNTKLTLNLLDANKGAAGVVTNQPF